MNNHATHPPVVAMRRIRKAFPGVVALDRVDLTLQAGEIHALAGENGSGKSTLAKILYGAHRPDAGVVEIDGVPVAHLTPRSALRFGIVAVSQELTLSPTLSVAENVLMGRIPRRRGSVDWPAARAKARETLQSLGVSVDERRRVDTLSVELQQEVEVARALSSEVRVLILDEATSALSEAATSRLLILLEELRKRDVAILFISHRLREFYQCASTASVLRDGKLVGSVSLATTPEQELVSRMVGREISKLFPERTSTPTETVLDVRALATVDGAVKNATFTVRRGEIVGIAGLVGCGKTELGLALAGAIAMSGQVKVAEKSVALLSPVHSIRAGIAYVPEDRKRSALFKTLTVRENLSVAWLHRISRMGIIRRRVEDELARTAAARFNVRTPSLEANIAQLSGGNQQKVVLGRWLWTNPALLVLAEPTRGIDVGAKSEVYASLRDLGESGIGILLISSELPELLGLADRILVMHEGALIAEFSAEEATEERVAHAAFGGAGGTGSAR
jgi:ABC-type sugar transport system ATPase subunit